MSEPRGEADPRPLVNYDGECAFCRRQVARLRCLTGEELRYRPFQELRPGEEPADQLRLTTAEGRTLHGAEAIVEALSVRRAWRWLLLPLRWPGLRYAAQALYRAVAARRYRLR